MIEIDGKEYRTKKQWERVHRHVREGAKGVERKWTSPQGRESATFYPRSATHQWTKAERHTEKRARAAAKRAAEDADLRAQVEQRCAEKYDEKLAKLALSITGAPADAETSHDYGWREFPPTTPTQPGTSYQWIAHGYVPLEQARWSHCGPADDYWYCHAFDVRYDPKRAEELMPGAPQVVDRLPDGRPYDGRPWW